MELVYINQAKKKFHSFSEHDHSVWEIMLIVEGRGRVFVSGKSYPVRKGNVLCIPPSAPHRSVSEEGMRDYCVAFEDFPIFQRKELKVLYDDTGSVETVLDMILVAVRRVPGNQKELLESLGNVFAQLLMALLDDGDGGKAIVHDFKKTMMDHLHDTDFVVGEAMRKSGFSEGYLRRIFRAATGLSPVQWLNGQRIEYAKRCFRQYPDLYLIREVGAMSGYSDPYYFSRIFKKYTGVSPRQFINNYRKEKHDRYEVGDEEIMQETSWTEKEKKGWH